jgi:hypothetical protein
VGVPRKLRPAPASGPGRGFVSGPREPVRCPVCGHPVYRHAGLERCYPQALAAKRLAEQNWSKRHAALAVSGEPPSWPQQQRLPAGSTDSNVLK